MVLLGSCKLRPGYKLCHLCRSKFSSRLSLTASLVEIHLKSDSISYYCSNRLQRKSFQTYAWILLCNCFKDWGYNLSCMKANSLFFFFCLKNKVMEHIKSVCLLYSLHPNTCFTFNHSTMKRNNWRSNKKCQRSRKNFPIPYSKSAIFQIPLLAHTHPLYIFSSLY